VGKGWHPVIKKIYFIAYQWRT